MITDPTLLAGAGAVGAAALMKGAANGEATKKLIGPLAENMGLGLGEIGDVFRFYLNDNLRKVFTKWAESRDQKPLGEEEVRKVLPLLRLASEQSDEDLQARWAALLEHAATSEQDVLPSFGQTLSQLTSEEAKFLDRLFASLSEPVRGNPYSGPERSVTRETLIQVYDSTIRGAMSHMELRHFGDQATSQQREARAKLDLAELFIQDMERLGILRHEAGAKIPIHKSTTLPGPRYSFTPYGLSFVRAVAQR